MRLNYEIISKEESKNNIINYFKNLDHNKLSYYINTILPTDIVNFVEENIYDEEDIELSYFLNEYIILAISKYRTLRRPIYDQNILNSIKISFITDLIYFEDIFVLDDVIYINYSYIKRVFELVEYTGYKNMDQVYIYNNKVYDKNLLKQLLKSLIYILQNKNSNTWIREIYERYRYFLIDKDEIKSIEILDKILLDINTSFLDNKIVVYEFNNKLYCNLRMIVSNSNCNYSPYYESILFELVYNINDKENYKYYLIKSDKEYSFDENPFEYHANKITNCIIY